jgi:hypothetical protein
MVVVVVIVIGVARLNVVENDANYVGSKTFEGIYCRCESLSISLAGEGNRQNTVD